MSGGNFCVESFPDCVLANGLESDREQVSEEDLQRILVE